MTAGAAGGGAKGVAMLLAAAPILADHLHHDHSGWWPIFPLLWLAFFFGIIFLIRRRGGCGSGGWRRGEAVLAERYARGEISEQELDERREILRKRRS
ncbi:MAG: hypothetical protein M3N53_03350 [Actinomycetota bacterium]|nr:hypothetical protein [Actinomycetota bacterium]